VLPKSYPAKVAFERSKANHEVAQRPNLKSCDDIEMGLPLRMNNLHAPTIPSGPSSVPAANGTNGDLSLKELETKKDGMEAELHALSSVLESVG